LNGARSDGMGVYLTQLFPFADHGSLQTFYDFEKAVYDSRQPPVAPASAAASAWQRHQPAGQFRQDHGPARPRRGG
jgi:hypothetical protein